MNYSAAGLYQVGLFNTPKSQLLRPFAFDFWLIFGVFLVALLSGALCLAYPLLFQPLLIVDLWLLGHHHVIATYTRLCFDLESLRRYKFLVFYLPFLVALPCVLLFYLVGPWLLASIFFYWQWFHYVRQSYGINRIYGRKSAELGLVHEKLNAYCLYAVALVGILYRSWESHTHFLGLELRVIPVSLLVLQISAVLAGVAFLAWLWSQWVQYKNGTFCQSRFMYLLTHHVIFVVSYLVISSLNVGWLVVNIWHNAQYILIVWLFNNNRFKDGTTSQAPFLSKLSQSKKWSSYVLVCLVLSTISYFGLQQVTSGEYEVVPIAIVVYSVINFHHYIVDGIIWKVRKQQIRKHLVNA